MKKAHLLSSLICLLLPISVLSQTYIQGFITTNTTWTPAGNPYIVTGNTLVDTAYTLTIDPGTEIKFDGQYAIQIKGKLIARGNSASHIDVTSNQTTPDRGDYGGFYFYRVAQDASFDPAGNYIDGCILEYVDMSYGGSTAVGEMVEADSTNVFINESSFTHSDK